MYFTPELAMYGIGVHHAGIAREDRSATEHLYLKKHLKVLFATSVSRLFLVEYSSCRSLDYQTLAVGVNLRE